VAAKGKRAYTVPCPVGHIEMSQFRKMAMAMGLTEAGFAHVLMRKAISDAWDVYQLAEKNIITRTDGYDGRSKHPKLTEEFKDYTDDKLPREIKTLSQVLNDPLRRPFRVKDLEGTFRSSGQLSANHYPRNAWEYWDGVKWEALHDTVTAFTITVNIKKKQARFMGTDKWEVFQKT
jgi:hypothetical protein